MMRYSPYRFSRTNAAQLAGAVRERSAHNRFEGYQFSLLAPPRATRRADYGQPYTARAVAPSLRSLVARTGNRCPECSGPLVNGEGCVACPVCGFSRQGW
jgi:hypothetical protein